MNLKLGRLPAVRPAALRNLETYATGPLPAPPATVEVPGGPWPMFGNDRYGDCTIAGAAHMVQAWNREVHENDHEPTETEVTETYFGLSGGADSGLNELDVLKHWHTRGMFGATIAGYAPVNPRNLLQLHQAVAFYGGCYLGIMVQEAQQEQFQAGEMWTWVDDAPIAGGHCVPALGYGPHGGLHVITWGGVAVLSAGYLAHALEEAWCVLPNQIVEAKKDALGLDLATLQADLTRV